MTYPWFTHRGNDMGNILKPNVVGKPLQPNGMGAIPMPIVAENTIAPMGSTAVVPGTFTLRARQ